MLGRTFGWPVMMSRYQNREGGIGLGAPSLDTHLDPWVGVRVDA